MRSFTLSFSKHMCNKISLILSTPCINEGPNTSPHRWHRSSSWLLTDSTGRSRLLTCLSRWPHKYMIGFMSRLNIDVHVVEEVRCHPYSIGRTIQRGCCWINYSTWCRKTSPRWVIMLPWMSSSPSFRIVLPTPWHHRLRMTGLPRHI